MSDHLKGSPTHARAFLAVRSTLANPYLHPDAHQEVGNIRQSELVGVKLNAHNRFPSWLPHRARADISNAGFQAHRQFTVLRLPFYDLHKRSPIVSVEAISLD